MGSSVSMAEGRGGSVRKTGGCPSHVTEGVRIPWVFPPSVLLVNCCNDRRNRRNLPTAQTQSRNTAAKVIRLRSFAAHSYSLCFTKKAFECSVKISGHIQMQRVSSVHRKLSVVLLTLGPMIYAAAFVITRALLFPSLGVSSTERVAMFVFDRRHTMNVQGSSGAYTQMLFLGTSLLASRTVLYARSTHYGRPAHTWWAF